MRAACWSSSVPTEVRSRPNNLHAIPDGRFALRLRFATLDLRERSLGGSGRGLDLGLPATEPEPPEGTERDHLEQMNLCSLLRFVRRDRGVGRGIDLEDVERLIPSVFAM